MTIEKAKELLKSLPEEYYKLAIENFDEEFYNEHKDKEDPIETSGDVLVASFDWASSPQGYPYWADVMEEYGWITVE